MTEAQLFEERVARAMLAVRQRNLHPKWLLLGIDEWLDLKRYTPLSELRDASPGPRLLTYMGMMVARVDLQSHLEVTVELPY